MKATEARNVIVLNLGLLFLVEMPFRIYFLCVFDKYYRIGLTEMNKQMMKDGNVIMQKGSRKTTKVGIERQPKLEVSNLDKSDQICEDPSGNDIEHNKTNDVSMSAYNSNSQI
jgi:hypothetical protein